MKLQKSDSKNSQLTPVLYLPHGGGPLPVLRDKSHEHLVRFFNEIPLLLGNPEAILVVSVHWETEHPTITSGTNPNLIYDYYGFPAESYEIKYAAPGHPQLAKDIFEYLETAGFDPFLDDSRGFDHGLFIPLKLMYPKAEIPCIQISLLRNLDPSTHIAIGRALAGLRRKNVAIIGSGLSYHNMNGIMNPGPAEDKDNLLFDRWLVETCTNDHYSTQEREQRLVTWHEAPGARACHPREEHMLPLHVCYGAAWENPSTAKLVFHDKVMGKMATGLLWA